MDPTQQGRLMVEVVRAFNGVIDGHVTPGEHLARLRQLWSQGLDAKVVMDEVAEAARLRTGISTRPRGAAETTSNS